MTLPKNWFGTALMSVWLEASTRNVRSDIRASLESERRVKQMAEKPLLSASRTSLMMASVSPLCEIAMMSEDSTLLVIWRFASSRKSM